MSSSLQLDARTRADLVAEAQARLIALCPELRPPTDGDPGLTLTELFAWMTGLAVERLGRVPDKLHVALLEMLGIELRGPTAARTDVRLTLSAPAQSQVSIRNGTEIMPPYGDALEPLERWRVVAFVRRLQKSSPALASHGPDRPPALDSPTFPEQ